MNTLEQVLRVIRLVTSGSYDSVIRFRILHRFRKAGSICLPGEEITAVYLLHREREVLLPLSLALRLLFDYLGHHRHLPQNAAQIAAGIKASAFYRNHGMNAGLPTRRKISRSAVKEYVKRIRKALNIALRRRTQPVDASRLLISAKTVGNEVQYRLCAPVEWKHVEDLPQ